MSSMVRRAELQTISRTTELFSVCCFWILAHLGQTRNNNGKIKQKKRVFRSREITEDLNIEQHSPCFKYEARV